MMYTSISEYKIVTLTGSSQHFENFLKLAEDDPKVTADEIFAKTLGVILLVQNRILLVLVYASNGKQKNKLYGASEQLGGEEQSVDRGVYVVQHQDAEDKLSGIQE